jgi:putative restriction endonuclease
MTKEYSRFGHVPGIAIGTTFDSYVAMRAAGIHNQTQAGIAGLAGRGAESIVISGGYEDDQDFGSEIIYTGQGGRDASGRHIADQKLERGNRALVTSELEKLPLRVIRGADRKNPFAPLTGYRYDGLFWVDSHWFDIGISGHKVWRYRLVAIENGDIPRYQIEDLFKPPPAENQEPRRTSVTVQRIVRDTAQAKYVKYFHRHTCQVCGIKLESGGGPYMEAAHIRPLGRPHDGPDIWDNILCLCPNHHVMFDLGAFSVAEDFKLIGIDGNLRVRKGHDIGVQHLAYHREHVFNPFVEPDTENADLRG